MNFKKSLLASSIATASVAFTSLPASALDITTVIFPSFTSTSPDVNGLTITSTGGIDLSSASFSFEAVSVASTSTADITIQAGGFISAVNNSTFTNISPTGINITAGLTGSITNDGTITAEDVAIDINGGQLLGDIDNGGTIQSTNETAILIEAFNGSITGDITNTASGNITGALAGVEVVQGATFTGNIFNDGTITGAGTAGDEFAAIEISSDISDSTVFTTTFIGSIQNNGTIQNTLTGVSQDALASGIGLNAVTLDGSIINGGVITSASAAGIALKGFEFSTTGATIPTTTVTGSITNSGTITGAVGITMNGSSVGSVVNNAGGAITGSIVGIGIDSMRLVVDFTGSTTGGSVEAAGLNNVSGSITNNGAISTTLTTAELTALGLSDPEVAAAIYVGRGATVTGNIVNGSTGTISASGTTGITIGNSAGGATTVGGNIENSGDITSASSYGVLLNGATIGGGVLNNAGATIDGQNGGIVAFNTTVTGAINNAGTIASAGPDGPNLNNGYGLDIQNATVGSVSNSGTITGGFISENSNTGAINNSGTIQSATAGGDAFVIRGGVSSVQGDITNTATGVITGSSGAQNNAGLVVEQGATVANITNSGTISGGAAAIGVVDGGSQVGLITNNAGGVITGGTFGAITSLTGGVIGGVDNAGTINGVTDFGAGGGSFDNTGSAGAVSGATGVTNSGTLGDVVLAAAGGSFSSSAGTVGDVTNILGDVTNGGDVGSLTFIGAGGSLTNTGTTGDVAGVTGVTTSGDMGNVQFAPGGGDFVSTAGSFGSINGVSTVDNSGTIVGINFVTGGGSLINNGVVSSDIVEVISLDNGGTLDDVTFVAAGGVFDNRGTLGNVANATSAFNDGVVGDIAFVGTSGLLANSGTAGNVTNAVSVTNLTGGSIGDVVFQGAGTYSSFGNTSVGSIQNAVGIAVYMDQQTPGTGVTTATVNGDLTLNGGILTFEATSTGAGINDYTQLAVTGNADVTGSTVFVLANGIDMFAAGDNFTILTAGGTLTSDISGFSACDVNLDTGCSAPVTSVTDNSGVLDFNIVQSGSSLMATIGDVNFTPTVPEDTTGNTGSQNTSTVATALVSVVNSNPGPGFSATELGSAINSLVALSTDNTPQGRAAYAKALGSLDAETVESGALSALQADTVAASTIDNRTAELRGQYGFSGAMAGDPMAINGFWAQGYGNETDQGIRDGVDGFDADTYGVGMGLDAPVGERMVVGLAFSYADTEVTMKQESNNGMDIGSYRLSAYGSYNADNYYLDGQLAYAMNDYETERAISPLLGSSLIAKGQHDGDQYNVRVRGGYPMATESGWFVTPIAEVNYTFLSEDKYSETGAGNLGLVLDANDVEVLVLSVGVKAAYPITTENEITWIPEVSLNYAYDTIGDEVEVDSNFVGVTGAAFITNGANVEQQAIKASFKIRTFSQGNFSFAAGYDYVDKADYDSQSLTATVRYDF